MAISAHALCVDDGAGRKRAPIQGRACGPCEQVILRRSKQLGRRSLHPRVGAQGAVCVPGQLQLHSHFRQGCAAHGLERTGPNSPYLHDTDRRAQWSLRPPSSLDLMAGLRLWQIKAEVHVPGLAYAQSNSSFVDPIVTARCRYEIAPRCSTLVYAHMGGLDVGSKFTWQTHGSLNYQVKENIFVSVGYRHLSVD